MTLAADVEAASIERMSRTRRWLLDASTKPFMLDMACLAVILSVALPVRLLWLDTVPRNVTADEASFMLNAWNVLGSGHPGPFGFDWTPSPAFSVYIIAGTMKVFGAGIVGARMSVVLLSAGTLVAFYFLARELLSRFAALLAAILLATNLWFLHFSRTAWTNMNADLFAVGGTLMLALAIRKGGWYWYAAAGVFAAFGLYGYYSGHLIILYFLAYLPVALLLNRDKTPHVLRGYAVMVIACLLVFLPQIKPLIDSWDYATTRVDNTSILNVDKPYLGESNMSLIIARQAVWAGRAFVLNDDGSVMGHGSLWPRYRPSGRGVVDNFTWALLLLGLGAAIWRWRKASLWLVMFVGTVFTVQVLSGGTPDIARGLIAAPFMFLLVGLAIELLLTGGQRLRVRVPSASVAVGVALVAGVAASSTMNVRDYFDWIGTPGALTARNPSVSHEAFPLWQKLEREAAEHNAIYDFHSWCGQHDAVASAGTIDEKVCLDVAPEEYGAAWEKIAVARDGQRRADLAKLSEQLATHRALENVYPTTGGDLQRLCGVWGRDASYELRLFLEPSAENFALVKRCSTYWYVSDGSTYTLYATLEAGPAASTTCPSVPEELAASAVYCVSGR